MVETTSSGVNKMEKKALKKFLMGEGGVDGVVGVDATTRCWPHPPQWMSFGVVAAPQVGQSLPTVFFFIYMLPFVKSLLAIRGMEWFSAENKQKNATYCIFLPQKFITSSAKKQGIHWIKQKKRQDGTEPWYHLI